MKLISVRISLRLIIALGLTGGGFLAPAQHAHLNIGAESQLQGSKLRVVNAAAYDTNSNFGGSSPPTPGCFFMNDTDPLYPGLYQVEISFSALPGTLWTGGPSPDAAAAGAFIEGKVTSVTGPGGGAISFWEENEEATETTRLFNIPVGTSSVTNRFDISEGVTTIDGPDPFGHIHGRRFAANQPGLYTVGFQMIDTSTAGAGGGPIHSPSNPTNYFYFQAGVYINSMIKSNDTVRVQYGARSFYNYYLETTTNLATRNWFTIATNETVVGPNGAHSDLHYLYDFNATNAARFYRLLEIPQ